MNRYALGVFAATTAVVCATAFSSVAIAQTGKAHIGTWTMVSSDTVNADGKRAPTFGGPATGTLVFGDDGRFSYLFSRADLPKFASNNRNTGTPAENAAVVQGSIATFGTYSVADNVFTIKVEHSTFPNWIGTEQKRTISVTGDDMKWSNAQGSGGGVVELVLKRVK